MGPTEITDTVDRTARLVAEHYVFPDVGARLGRLLDERLAGGAYQNAASPEALATAVTADLQSLNGDPHLRLLHHPTGVPDLADHEELVQMFTRHAERTMGGVARVERLAGNIGHLALGPLLFPPSMSGEAITAAMRLVAHTEVLLVDLRDNGGGDPETVALVCSYLFDEPVHLNSIYRRDDDSTRQSWTLPFVPGTRFGGGKPIYVLTSAATFSGAEELTYDLQQRGRATVVGERTRGGAHPRVGFRVHPHLEASVPNGRAINPVSGTNWEGTGVAPDVEVAAEQALPAAYRLALEHVSGLDTDPQTVEEARAALAALDGQRPAA